MARDPGQERRKRLTLLAAILGAGIVLLDSTVVNVALPAIRADFDAGLASQQWVVEAYLLTLGSLLLVGGSLGDLLGRRRVFAVGLAGFGAASLLCAIAPTVELLIVARALQGVAGALLVPSSLALIEVTFPPDERGRAIGTWTAFGGIATVVGPLGGGVLIELADWRWVFALNVPVVVVTLVVLRGLAADAPRPEGARVDVTGAVLCALGLAGPVFALIQQPTHGWGDPQVALPLAAGVLLLGAFLVHERRTRDPMLPLGLFARGNFAVGNASTLTMYAGFGVALFFIVLFLQQVAGFGAIEAGLSLLPITVLMFLLSRRFGALADRLGPRLFMGAGPVLAGTGLAMLSLLDDDVNYLTDVLPGLAVFGLGLSMTVAPLTATVLASVEERHAGVASGVNNAIARVAGLLAIAAVGAVVAAQFASSLDGALAGQPLDPAARRAADDARARPLAALPEEVRSAGRPRLEEAVTDASVSAFRVGMLVSGGLVVAGGLLSAVGIRNPRRRVEAERCQGGAFYGHSREAAPGGPLGDAVAAPAASRS